MLFRVLTIALLALLISAPAQDYDSQLRQNRSRLDAIRDEIDSLKKQLQSTEKKAGSIDQQINQIDKEIALIARTKGLLLREQRLLEQRLKNSRLELNDTRDKMQKLKDLYAQRLVYTYKHGKVRDLELILTAQSLNQALIRYRYLARIAEQDEKTIRQIEEKENRIRELQRQLTADLEAKNRSLREKLAEEQRYKARLDEKQQLLASVKKDESFYQRQITQKQQEREKLTQLIATLERERKLALERQRTQKPDSPRPAEAPVVIDFDDFKKGKGRLPWPVSGKVISKFGKQYDAASRTYVTNSGIEISSELGAPVKSVFTGVIRMITYLSGYGNTVIIDHGHGYYTVYSHLGEIYVQKNDVVDNNQVIARVGDSGALAGSKLHFEIYGGNQTYDPLAWLK